MTFTTAFIAAALVGPSMPQPEYDDGEVITNCVVAYSMLTHDGRRMISRKNGGKTVYELVPTNRRGRFDVGGNWCGSTTHVMGYEELCRSL